MKLSVLQKLHVKNLNDYRYIETITNSTIFTLPNDVKCIGLIIDGGRPSNVSHTPLIINEIPITDHDITVFIGVGDSEIEECGLTIVKNNDFEYVKEYIPHAATLHNDSTDNINGFVKIYY